MDGLKTLLFFLAELATNVLGHCQDKEPPMEESLILHSNLISLQALHTFCINPRHSNLPLEGQLTVLL
jgi:hypothetical protein